jgi:hypothetical protein
MFDSSILNSIMENLNVHALEDFLKQRKFKEAIFFIERYSICWKTSEIKGIDQLVRFCLFQSSDVRKILFMKLKNYVCVEDEVRIAMSGRVFDFFCCCKTDVLASLLVNSFQQHILENDLRQLIPYFIREKWSENLLRQFSKHLTNDMLLSKLTTLDNVERRNLIPLAIEQTWPIEFFIMMSESLDSSHVCSVLHSNALFLFKEDFMKVTKSVFVRNKYVLKEAIRFGWTEYFNIIDEYFKINFDDIFFDETSIREAVRLKRKQFINFVLKHESFLDVVIESVIDEGFSELIDKETMQRSEKSHIHFRNVCEKKLIDFIPFFNLSEVMTEMMIKHHIGMHSHITNFALMECAFEARDFNYVCKFIKSSDSFFKFKIQDNFYNLLFRIFNDNVMSQNIAERCIQEDLTEPLYFILNNALDKVSILMMIQRQRRWNMLSEKLIPHLNQTTGNNSACQCKVFEKNVVFPCSHFTHCWNCVLEDTFVAEKDLFSVCKVCMVVQRMFLVNGCPPADKLFLDCTSWKITSEKTNFLLMQH